MSRSPHAPTIQCLGEDRIFNHPGEVGFAVVVITTQVHLARGELLEAEGATHAPERIETGHQVQGHRAPVGLE